MCSHIFDKVKIRVDKVFKGEGTVKRMWSSEKAWFTDNKHIESRETTPEAPERTDSGPAAAGGAGERRKVPKNLKRKGGQHVGTDWAPG